MSQEGSNVVSEDHRTPVWQLGHIISRPSLVRNYPVQTFQITFTGRTVSFDIYIWILYN